MTAVGPHPPHPIDAFMRTRHHALSRWLTARFGRKLSAEDIGDVLSETYRAALETEQTRDFADGQLGAWLYQVARFRAIDLLRRREYGDGGAPPRYVSLEPPDGELEPADPGPGPYDAFVDGLAERLRAEEARLVDTALRRLPAAQRETLQHVHIDGLSTRAAAELLGVSKSQFHRTYQRALERLRSLCAAEQSPDCGRARRLSAADATLDPALLGWRDAHVEGCFSCQVAVGRRAAVLLPALPLIATPHAATRALARAVELPLDAERWLLALATRAGASAAPAEAAAGAGAVGGGAVAGSSLLGGLGIKAAACAVAALTCVGVATPVISSHDHGRTARSVASAPSTHTRHRHAQTPAAAVATVAPRPVATATARASSTAAAARPSTAAQHPRAAAHRRTARHHARTLAAHRSPGGEFSPESFTTPTRNAGHPTAAAASTASTSAPPATSQAAPDPPASSSAPSSTSGATHAAPHGSTHPQFAREFRP